MNTTIAYSHKGGFWKTKYSFLSSWFARVGKAFYSSKSDASEEPVWRHNDNSVPRTAYYMAEGGTPIGSGISASFNKNVSQNKIYKSFSIEGSSNISGVNSFVVNSDSGTPKTSSVGPIKDKGGILYGHIGLSPTTFDGSNISLIGEITSDALVDPNAEDATFVYFYMKGNNLSTSSVTNALFFGSGQSFYESTSGASLTLSSATASTTVTGTKVANIAVSQDVEDPTVFTPHYDPDNNGTAVLRGREVKLTAASSGQATAFKTALGAVQASVGVTEKIFLYEMSFEGINGSPPRGQYAQLNVSLGSEPYELYALNLNYEPTDLDHTK